jgi:hypothetical protein
VKIAARDASFDSGQRNPYNSGVFKHTKVGNGLMRRAYLILATSLALGLFTQGSASAQSFDLPAPERPHIWDFAMWCSALQDYPNERCEERPAEDVEDYNAYVARGSRFATAREYKPWLGPYRERRTNPGYQSPY